MNRLAAITVRESEERYRLLVENINDVAYGLDNDGVFNYISPVIFPKTGFSQKEILNHHFTEFVHPDDLAGVKSAYQFHMSSKGPIFSEFRAKRKDGTYFWVRISSRPLMKYGHAVGLYGLWTDIDALKNSELELRKTHAVLELRVKERTEELEIKENKLEELNATLRVLLEKKDEDKRHLEEIVLNNVKQLIEPFLEKLKKCDLDNTSKAYVDILESNLNDIVSPFAKSLSSTYSKLSPQEIQIANLLRQGKSTKEIAALFNLSAKTIQTHRRNIRKKLGLNTKRVNLRTYFLAIQ